MEGRLSARPAADERGRDEHPGLAQITGRDEAVAAVIPFAADDEDGLAGEGAAVALERACDPLPGPLHEHCRRNAERTDREAVTCLHFSRCDDGLHEASVEAG